MLDVAIVGRRPGRRRRVAALACARPGLAIAVFEARPGASGDARTLALSHASRERLEEARAWPAAAATPITSIHISQKGGPGRTLIEAAEQGLPALGYTVPYAALEAALAARLARSARRGALRRVVRSASRSRPTPRRCASPRGARRARACSCWPTAAPMRRASRASRSTRRTTASRRVVGAVRTDRPHGGRAYERFTPRGPLALLPVRGSLRAGVDRRAGRGRAAARARRGRLPRASCRRTSAIARAASSRSPRAPRSRCGCAR